MSSISPNVLWKRTPVVQRVLLLRSYFISSSALSQVPAVTATIDVARTGAATSLPPIANAPGNPKSQNNPKLWWVPGGDNVFTSDNKVPYTGDQSCSLSRGRAAWLKAVVPGRTWRENVYWRRSYRTFALRDMADPDSDNAALEITGTGTGKFQAGAVSLMSAPPPERKNTL